MKVAKDLPQTLFFNRSENREQTVARNRNDTILDLPNRLSMLTRVVETIFDLSHGSAPATAFTSLRPWGGQSSSLCGVLLRYVDELGEPAALGVE